MGKTISGGTYLSYNNILLKVYYDVATTGNYELLLVSGKYNVDDATKVWEGIIRDNYKATNNRKYIQYLDAYREYERLCNDQSFVSAALTRLHFPPIDRELIKDLATKGFKINLENSEKYAASLKACDVQSRSYNTRITMQKNILDKIHKEGAQEAKGKGNNMQANLVRVGTALGLVLPQDILLSTFNEYMNVMRDKISANQKAA